MVGYTDLEVTLTKQSLADIVNGLYCDSPLNQTRKSVDSSHQQEPEYSQEPSVCAKQFKSQSSILQHVRTNGREKPYEHRNEQLWQKKAAVVHENLQLHHTFPTSCHENVHEIGDTSRCQLKSVRNQFSEPAEDLAHSKSFEENYTTRTDTPKEPTLRVVNKAEQQAREDLSITKQHEMRRSHTRERSTMSGEPVRMLPVHQQNVHKGIHRARTVLHCRFCGKEFASKSAVIQHEMTHTNTIEKRLKNFIFEEPAQKPATSKSSEHERTTRTEKPKELFEKSVCKDGQQPKYVVTIKDNSLNVLSSFQQTLFTSRITLSDSNFNTQKHTTRTEWPKEPIEKSVYTDVQPARYVVTKDRSLNLVNPCQQNQFTCRSTLSDSNSSEQEHTSHTQQPKEPVKRSKEGQPARMVSLLTKDQSAKKAAPCQQKQPTFKGNLAHSKSSERKETTGTEKSKKPIEKSVYENGQQARDGLLVILTMGQSPNAATTLQQKQSTCQSSLTRLKTSEQNHTASTEHPKELIDESVHKDGQNARDVGLLTKDQTSNVATPCQQKQSTCKSSLAQSKSSEQKRTARTKTRKRRTKRPAHKDGQQAGDADVGIGLLTKDQSPSGVTSCQQKQQNSPDSKSSDRKHTTRAKKRGKPRTRSPIVVPPCPEPPFGCRRCGTLLKSANGWMQHQEQELKPYRCDICGSGFIEPTDLVKHHYIHWIQCTFCNELFNYARSRDITEHEDNAHFDQGSHKCRLCDTTFKSSFEQSVHERTHVLGTGRHVTLGGITYLVPPLSCKSPPRFYNLMRRQDEKLRSPFRCSYCEDLFTRESTRDQHQETHPEHIPFACSFCGKLFKEEHLLVHHQVQHIDGEPLPCKYCGKLFTKLFNKAEHEQSHLKPFRCLVCKVRYKEVRELVNHHSAHLLNCIYCGEEFSFARVKDLIEHEESHAAKEQLGGIGSDDRFDPAIEVITGTNTCQITVTKT